MMYKYDIDKTGTHIRAGIRRAPIHGWSTHPTPTTARA
eukprot:SAG11_NODE_35235_length_267_cov_1.327381_1_plen_37_part_01